MEEDQPVVPFLIEVKTLRAFLAYFDKRVQEKAQSMKTEEV